MSEDEAEIWAILDELKDDLLRTLGGELVGLSVYGSFVSGGFDPGVSDLDLIAITETPPEDLDLRAIEAMHRAFVERHPAWTDRIEVVYVAREAVRAFRTSSIRMAVISPGEPFHLRPEPPDRVGPELVSRTGERRRSARGARDVADPACRMGRIRCRVERGTPPALPVAT